MSSHQDILNFVQNDTRTKDEIFESLKQQIQEDYDFKLTEEEAVAATRRLLGVFQVFSDVYDRKQLKKLENEDEND